MKFDALLPTIVFINVTISVFFYQKIGDKIKLILNDRKFRVRDVILMVIAMGLMVTIMTFVSSQAIQIVLIAAYSYMMFIFTYIVTDRWYIASLLPIIFILFYFYYWELYIFNTFVMILAIIITVYLGNLFSWRSTWIFAILLTIMDIYQVWGTGFMVEAAGKMLEIKLPIAVILHTYPVNAEIILGVGDIFLSGLLAVQTSLKHGKNAGILIAATISIALFVFEIFLFNSIFEGVPYFPATIICIVGWFIGMGIMRLIHLKN